MTSRELKQVPTSKAADLCQTPGYALDPLYDYLKPDWVIWEPAAGDCTLVNALYSKGYQVIASDILSGQDFFKYRPDRVDMILTNPPFSLKLKWLERCYSLGLPFALLLPVEILGVGAAQRLFEAYGLEVILLNRRVDFQTTRTSFAKSSAWFPVCWITARLNVGQSITYGKLTKRPDQQMPLFKAA